MLTVEKRSLKKKNKQLRREGLVPANIFGGPLEEAMPIQLREQDAVKLRREKNEGSRLDLQVEGEVIPVQIKDADTDPLTGKILHIDFEALKRGHKVNSVVHIVLKNAEKMLNLLDTQLMEIPYNALPRDMIDTVTVDLDGVTPGTVILVKDIPELMTGKLELLVEEDSVVVHVKEHAGHAPEAEEAAAE